MSTTEDYQAEVRKLRRELTELRTGIAATAGKPKRLSLSEILQAHLDHLARSGGEHSSVELTRNAKGDTQIKVAVRTGDTEAVATVEDAAAKCREVYDALRMLFPLGAPNGD